MHRRQFLAMAGASTLGGLALPLCEPNAQPRVQTHADGTVQCVDIASLHQILILDGMRLPERLPDIVQDNTAMFKQFYPNATYKLWGGEELRAFVEQRMGRRVVQAFDSLKPYAYKSDLARYCLLYELGGLYSDLLFEHRAALKIPVGYRVVAFKDVPFLSRYAGGLCNSFLWSLPNRSEYAIAIERIVYHCQKKFYGLNILDPTGPLLLGHAFATAASNRWIAKTEDDQLIGETINHGDWNAFVIWPPEGGKDDGIDAMLTVPKIDIGGRPKQRPRIFEMQGTNNYHAMWEARDIYR